MKYNFKGLTYEVRKESGGYSVQIYFHRFPFFASPTLFPTQSEARFWARGRISRAIDIYQIGGVIKLAEEAR